MSSPLHIKPRLFAFDLDGTLLNSKKELNRITIEALTEMSAMGIFVTFASGRIRSSIQQYIPLCNFPISVVSLNGAAVYTDSRYGESKVYDASLPAKYADYLIDYSEKTGIAMNYYFDEKLYAAKNDKNIPWLELYFNQTRTTYIFQSSLNNFYGQSPSKVIFVASPDVLDEQQSYFSKLWGDSIYLCRTWDYYLEFLNPLANKGIGLQALATFYNISMNETVTFGDALNDIPMLHMAGFSVAVSNSPPEVKNAAKKISSWSNDQNAIAEEWSIFRDYLSR